MIEGTVVVSRKGADRIARGHPWVFRSDVMKAREVAPGAIVRVTDRQDQPLGFAFHSSRSEIRLRMIERGASLAESFLRDRLARALRWRETVAAGDEAYRVVHGEGDGLPGLVVDRYGDYLAIQTLSQATDRRKDEIVEALVDLLRPKGILERNDPRVRQLEGLEQRVGLLFGEVPERVEVAEDDVVFRADLWKGQKTGLFLDQRENHRAARGYARGRVLDVFTYDGGFGLHAARVADEVVCVDVSAEALARVRANADRNRLTNVRVLDANAFDLLHAYDDRGERFDTVVLDPPAFAKSKDAIERAWRGYKQINLRALRLLRPGGCLVTCSCSYHVREADFEAIVAEAAADAGLTVTLVEKRRQARDHPILLGVPETYYLKCLILRRLE